MFQFSDPRGLRQRSFLLALSVGLGLSQVASYSAAGLATASVVGCKRLEESSRPITGGDLPSSPLPVLEQPPISLAQASGKPVTGGPLEAPLSLSDPDGQDLTLEKLDVRAAVQGMLSLTELELVFRNPHPRRMEGRFTCVLPPGATISRFAKEVNGVLMEGEVVERLRANRIYDEILHQMRDPALLEQDQGNRFSARIFPIEANGQVRLILSYTRTLGLEQAQGSAARTFALPLRGLPTVQSFHFKGLFSALPGERSASLSSGQLSGPRGATASTVQVLELSESNYTPQQDLEVRWTPAGALEPAQLLAAGDFYLAAVRVPGLPPTGTTEKLPWVFYVDTSASSAEGEQHRIRALEQLIKSLPKDASGEATVKVLAFDQTLQPLLEGRAGEVAAKVGAALLARHSLGGTDLALVLEHMLSSKGPSRFVLVSDGVATLGKTDARELLTLADRLPVDSRLHALVLGSRQDQPTLKGLTQGRGRIVTVPFSESLDQKAMEAAAQLALPPGQNFDVADAGAEWVYPTRFTDVQPGAELIVVGKQKPGQLPRLALSGKSGKLGLGANVQALPMGTFEPLLEREGYRAYLDHLAEREARETDPGVRQALADQQVKLSIERRVMIPRTTLLVLETEQDYARFGLDRTALAAILTVGGAGIERIDRTRAQQVAQPIVRPTEPPVRPEPRPIADPKPITQNRPTGDRGASASGQAATGAAPRGGEVREEQERAPQKSAEARGPSAAPASAAAPMEAKADISRDDALMDDLSKGGMASHNAPARVLANEDGAMGGSGEGLSGGIAGGTLGGVAGGPSVDSDQRSLAVASAPPPAVAAPRPAEPERARRNEAPSRVSRPAPESARPPRTEGEQGLEREEADGFVAFPGGPVGKKTTGKVALPEWAAVPTFADEQLKSLEAQVQANPRDRRGWNQLSDALLWRKDWKGLIETALRWQPFDPENPHVYEMIGEAALQLKQLELAARAFASLVEVAPGKVELLQRAGVLLVRAGGSALSETPLRRALELRPDRVNTYRHLALVLWQQGRLAEAAKVLEDATKVNFPAYYGSVQRIVREELAYIYRAWMAQSPDKQGWIEERARQYGADLSRTDQLRLTLIWETDANDVDLHVVDPNGEECYYSHKNNASGLELYEDITQGFGPEVIRGERLPAGTYYAGVKYFSAGPMGISRGFLVAMVPNPSTGAIQAQILPFRLVEGGRDMRFLAAIDLQSDSARPVRPVTK